MRNHLRRLAAGAGLLLLLPLGVQLATDQVTATDAGTRGAILFGGVMLARVLAKLAPERAPAVPARSSEH